MTHTFLVAVNLSDGSFDPSGEADDIRDDLEHAGHDVVSVKMWQAPSLGKATLPPMPQQQL